MQLFEKGKFRNKRLEGNFTASLKNDSVCAEGKVFLTPKNKIEKKLKIIEKSLSTSLNKTETNVILKSGDDYSIYCKNQKIKLEITDADLEDGDKIELKINDIIILDNYTTTKIKKTITYKLINEDTYINIKSISDGKSPPNTSVVKIIDGENINPIVTEMKKDQNIKIKLVYKKK